MNVRRSVWPWSTLLLPLSTLGADFFHSDGVIDPLFGMVNPDSGLVIHGEITRGDFEIFLDVLAQRSLTSDGDWTVILDSPGGDLAEAMKIGRFIRRSLMTAKVLGSFQPTSDGHWRLRASMGSLRQNVTGSNLAPVGYANGVCYSACFLIWIAAPERFSRDPNSLGIRRSDQAHSSDTEALDRQDTATDDAIRQYLAEMEVPVNIINRVFSKPSDELLLFNWSGARMLWQPHSAYDEWLPADCPHPSPPAQIDSHPTRSECQHSMKESARAEARSLLEDYAHGRLTASDVYISSDIANPAGVTLEEN